MSRSRVAFVALASALALAGVLSLIGLSEPKAHQHLSASSTDDTTQATLPHLDVPVADLETTTTTVVATTTTAAAPVTTTAPAPTTTSVVPPTTQPAPTVPVGMPSAVIDSIVNHWSHPIDYTIGSGTTAHWVLQPNQTAGPATIGFGEHGDSSSSHAVSDPTCGRGDNDKYFAAGHHYTLEILYNGIPNGCGDSALPGYKVVMRDVTTGVSREIG